MSSALGRGTASPNAVGSGSSPQLEAGEEFLLRAAELIARGWCKNALARDRYGRQVEPWSETAVAWSLLGALMKGWYDSEGRDFVAFEAAYESLAQATGGRLEEWNGARWRTAWHVLKAVERACTRLRDLRRGVSR
jgi:hypothetical protein